MPNTEPYRPSNGHKHTIGETITFPSGGRILICWRDTEWVGYAKYYPGSTEPILERMEPVEFEQAVTRQFPEARDA